MTRETFNQETGRWEAEKESPEFQIWMEGYAVSGNDEKARFIGFSHGRDFREACINYFERHADRDFDEKRLTVWGCQLFDNEIDARKAFG